MIDTKEKVNSVYTAHSKHNFYARKMISAFVLENNMVPLNPFTNWDYFMCDMVDRSFTVRANNNLIYLADELWQFGIVSNGCYHEIKLAMSLNKKIRFFEIGKMTHDIKEMDIDKLEFEEQLKEEYDMDEFKEELIDYLKESSNE